ncbi:hypothetical protein GAYE_SCF02G2062 [Galdieria yellowstonensis]|uniref:Uncharacterized protein n=1 Tax=Galdieria yellowstonensis TaxID=3028027 RepID=A0AAV9I9Y0_9RHOD|nr:hypothetical protein GAYE_SCF02G2062 [Galdieria yellowstonensis]
MTQPAGYEEEESAVATLKPTHGYSLSSHNRFFDLVFLFSSVYEWLDMPSWKRNPIKLTSALPQLFEVSSEVFCTSLFPYFVVGERLLSQQLYLYRFVVPVEEALEKGSRPCTYLPIIAVFARRDCKFSVLDKVSKYHSVPLRACGCTWNFFKLKRKVNLQFS